MTAPTSSRRLYVQISPRRRTAARATRRRKTAGDATQTPQTPTDETAERASREELTSTVGVREGWTRPFGITKDTHWETRGERRWDVGGERTKVFACRVVLVAKGKDTIARSCDDTSRRSAHRRESQSDTQHVNNEHADMRGRMPGPLCPVSEHSRRSIPYNGPESGHKQDM